MTEEEAKTKTCPLAAMRGANGNWDKGYCIGSSCMAWREIREKYTPPGGDPFANDAWKSTRVVGGYCGLAGEP